MGISSIYGSSSSIYTNRTNNGKAAETSGSQTEKLTQEAASAGAAASRTAADELSYLSSKYKNYSFVAANFTQGMQYGSSSTTNVAISPEFLAKMANDPELEKEYEGYIADMQQLDAQFTKSVEAGGWHVVAQGWAIDKDGGISSWCITQKDDTKSYLQKLSETSEKILEKTSEKKEQQAELEEKRQADLEEAEKLQEALEEAYQDKFGGRFAGLSIMDQEEEPAAVTRTMLDIRA